MASFEAERLPPTEELVLAAERPAASLLVACDGRLVSHTLRAGQVIEIGRSPEATVRIDEPWISRRHARLIVGPPLQLEDLGSANGVHCAGRRLARGTITPIAAGDVVELGRTMLIVREAFAPASLSGDAMATARALVERIAPTELPILFLGETGAGKQVRAEAAHRASRRSAGPFVRVHLAGLSDARFAAEVLGEGSEAPGLLAQATGGTLFLDQIAELEPRTQARLLEMLERAPGITNVRFMAATHRSLRDEVEAGRFRADLLFRINGVSIHVPPLRERGAELRGLADELLAAACARSGREVPRWTGEALACLAAYPWPGNVRELAHTIERAVAVHERGVIDVADLGLPAAFVATDAPRLRDALDSLEEERIRQALVACGGNQSAAARKLGMSRNTLIARIRSYGLPRPHGRTS